MVNAAKKAIHAVLKNCDVTDEEFNNLTHRSGKLIKLSPDNLSIDLASG